MTTPFLEFVGVHKSFGATVALHEVALSVGEGELLGLLGPNGAGKTTLLSIAGCLLSATRGEVRLAGQRLDRHNRDLRRLIGVVPQEIALYGELTAWENLEFFATLYQLDRSVRKRRIEETLHVVGLTERAFDRVRTFSGGMKRRLNLGAALLHQPRLLLLDEPTTGVDPHSRNHIFEEVRRLHASGITIVYTSHYLKEVEALCQRVAILNEGHIVACDTVPGLRQQATGMIRFRVPEVTEPLRQRLDSLPATRFLEREGRPLELICNDPRSTVIRLFGLLKELGVELLSLETFAPDLEQVFLELTGSQLT
ncbi:MAG: antibiotic ABC transporter ATP-binding protein [Gemmatales bacterium]|nr:MAG: antibiotic ABC transporter ATP-binding protein [Gemmatales bacterium]